MQAIEIQKFARIKCLFYFPEKEEMTTTARRVAKLVICFIPYLILDFFYPKTSLELRKENGEMVIRCFSSPIDSRERANAQRDIWPRNVVKKDNRVITDAYADIWSIVEEYLGQEEKWNSVLFSSNAVPTLKAWARTIKRSGCITWNQWIKYHELFKHSGNRLIGTPSEKLQLDAVNEIHLEDCEATKAQIDDFFSRFTTLAGKQLYLPKKHTIAHFLVIQNHLDEITKLELISFTCDIFEREVRGVPPLNMTNTIELFRNKKLEFKRILFPSCHAGYELFPLTAVQTLLRLCPQKELIALHNTLMQEGDLIALRDEFKLGNTKVITRRFNASP